jgi:hypothetical protein
MELGPIPTTLAGSIDRLGELCRRIEFKPVVEQERQLTGLLLARAEGCPADLEGEDAGAHYFLWTSKRAEQQTVKNWDKVFRWLKRGKFLELATITFDQLKANLTTEQCVTVVEKQRTGHRKLDLVLRAESA